MAGLVEDYWRAFVSLSQTNTAAADEFSQRFGQRIQTMAGAMEPLESAPFLQAVSAELDRVHGEYFTDSASQKRRLGIPLGGDAPLPHRSYAGGTLGDLVVRTTIRATIWESIRALFRLWR